MWIEIVTGSGELGRQFGVSEKEHLRTTCFAKSVNIKRSFHTFGCSIVEIMILVVKEGLGKWV